jgi:hypothetical protein
MADKQCDHETDCEIIDEGYWELVKQAWRQWHFERQSSANPGVVKETLKKAIAAAKESRDLAKELLAPPTP